MSNIPADAKTYLTPEGYAAIEAELRELLREERPKLVETVRWAASNGDRSENGDYIYGKRRLREIDRRVRYLTKRAENGQIVDPALQQNLDQVFFGATVTYEDETEQTRTVKIVGIDEADIKQNKISYTSPVAKAFMKKQVGDEVSLQAPGGMQYLTILSIHYA